jgi:hypothetical protein
MPHHDNEPVFLDISPAIVTYKGTVLGATVDNPEAGTHGGCSVTISNELRNTMRDVEGTNEHDAILVGQMVTVQCNLTGQSLEQLAAVIPGCALSTAPTVHKKLIIGNGIGSSMRAQAGVLIVTQAEDGIASTDPRDSMRLYNAYPLPEIEFAFDLENQKVYTVTFRGLRNSSGLIGEIGADVTAT